MSEHRSNAPSIPFVHNVPQHPTGKTESRYIRGAYPFEPAMEFKEIAAALGMSVPAVQATFYKAMYKLGCSAELLELWRQVEDQRAQSDRRISTPYARSMRVAVVDVAPSEMEAIQ